MNEILKKCVLFRNFSDEEIAKTLKNINTKVASYLKDQVIALEGDQCTSIGVVLEGSIEIQKNYASGKSITIDRLIEGNIFGEVIIFSEMHRYPSTVMSVSNTRILFISKEEVVTLCITNTHILNNFMGLLSNKILMLNKKIKNLSYQTIRQKVSSYLLEEYQNQKKTMITLNLKRKEMADHLGIPRPSLSRELIHMQDEGLIEFDGNVVKILDLERLEFEL
ncbi:MAG: Crp/Fnr family transcriptional regulator [Clostridia bacterium]|nr:Crp/Fnr family transcriptional regulator [Clostridia bacterium]